jgi:hypothetical protein
VLVGGPASVGVQAVEPSGLFRLSSRTLLAAARRDARVSWAVAGELNRRLYDTFVALRTALGNRRFWNHHRPRRPAQISRPGNSPAPTLSSLLVAVKSSQERCGR